MEPGKIRLINSGGQSDAGFTHSVIALDTLQLFGSYDTI